MTTRGFYSTVLSREGLAMVRARAREDLEAFLAATGSDADILATEGSDYPFRVIVGKDVWAGFLRSEAEGIDYRNFKDAVTARQGRRRHDVYLKVWSALLALQERARPMSDPGGRVSP